MAIPVFNSPAFLVFYGPYRYKRNTLGKFADVPPYYLPPLPANWPGRIDIGGTMVQRPTAPFTRMALVGTGDYLANAGIGSFDGATPSLERLSAGITPTSRGRHAVLEHTSGNFVKRIPVKSRVLLQDGFEVKRLMSDQEWQLFHFYHDYHMGPLSGVGIGGPVAHDFYRPEQLLNSFTKDWSNDLLFSYDLHIPTYADYAVLAGGTAPHPYSGKRATLIAEIKDPVAALAKTVTVLGDAWEAGFRIGMVCSVGDLLLTPLAELVRIKGIRWVPGGVPPYSVVEIETFMAGTLPVGIVSPGGHSFGLFLHGFTAYYPGARFAGITLESEESRVGDRHAVFSYNFDCTGRPIVLKLENAIPPVLTGPAPAAQFSGRIPDGSYGQYIFTVNPGTDVVTATGHTFAVETRVAISTTDTVPLNLSTNTVYRVITVVAQTFKLALETAPGVAVDIGDAGTGTHFIWSLDVYDQFADERMP